MRQRGDRTQCERGEKGRERIDEATWKLRARLYRQYSVVYGRRWEREWGSKRGEMESIKWEVLTACRDERGERVFTFSSPRGRYNQHRCFDVKMRDSLSVKRWQDVRQIGTRRGNINWVECVWERIDWFLFQIKNIYIISGEREREREKEEKSVISDFCSPKAE